MPGPEDPDAAYRILRGTSFHARVEPIWLHFQKTKKQRGFVGSLLERRRLKGLIGAVRQATARKASAPGRNPGPWDRKDGECVAAIQIARLGLLQELRTVVLGVFKPPDLVRHFHHLRESRSLSVPVSFENPILYAEGARTAIPITSSVRLAVELEQIGRTLQLDTKMRADRMAAFLEMKEPDVLKAEREADDVGKFWTLFGYAVLKKLADLSVEHSLPIVFS